MTTVINGTSTSASAPAVVGDDGDTGVFFPTANTLAFSAGGAEICRVAANGLGIGTTSIGARLVVSASGNIARFGDGTNTFDIRFQGPNNWAQQLNTSTDVFSIQRNSTDFFSVNPSGSAVLRGAVTSADGIGITFPASQSASSNANTLDDYEEGTFTPSYTSAGISAVTYGTGRNGYYTKIGRMVTIVVNIMTDAVTVTNGSSFVFITGLPFTAAALTELNSTTGITLTSRFNANPPTGGVIGNNSTQYTLYRTVNTTADDPAQSTVSDFKTGAGNVNTLRFTATYFTAT